MWPFKKRVPKQMCVLCRKVDEESEMRHVTVCDYYFDKMIWFHPMCVLRVTEVPEYFTSEQVDIVVNINDRLLEEKKAMEAKRQKLQKVLDRLKEQNEDVFTILNDGGL